MLIATPAAIIAGFLHMFAPILWQPIALGGPKMFFESLGAFMLLALIAVGMSVLFIPSVLLYMTPLAIVSAPIARFLAGTRIVIRVTGAVLLLALGLAYMFTIRAGFVPLLGLNNGNPDVISAVWFAIPAAAFVANTIIIYRNEK